MVASAFNVFENRVAVALLRRYNDTAMRFLFPQTPLRATKMAPHAVFIPQNALAGYQNGTATRFLFPRNALAGYQNGTATRFLLKPQYGRRSKIHVKLIYKKNPSICHF